MAKRKLATGMGHGLLLLLAGCADEYRIGLDEFLQRQRHVESVQRAELSDEEQSSPAMLDRQLGPFRAGPNDVLEVSLTTGEPTPRPPTRVRVGEGGEIKLPLVGKVRVTGLTLQEIEEVIFNAYSPDVLRDVAVYVEVADPDSTNVLVVGAVPTPGLVALRRTDRNMLFAIVAAGGVAEIASGEATLRRLRRPSEEVTLDLTDPVQLRAAVALDPLEDGDIIEVHAARPNTIFVGGLVNRPAPQTYPPGTRMTVLQALAAAGGLRTDVTPKEGTLVRRMPGGQDVHVKLNLQQLARAEAPNITLEPGDILWVPETLETRIKDFINRNIFLRAGATVTYQVTGVEFMNRRGLQAGRFGGDLEDTFDPFGFLTRNQVLRTIQSAPAANTP